MGELATTDQIKRLQLRHQVLDRELSLLSRRAYLTPGEQRLAQELKKQKLQAKDALFKLKQNGR